MQAFGGGFIKGHPQDVLVGNGGYESGQGSRSGPCWCDGAGVIKNEFGRFDDVKEKRERRDNDYRCEASAWFLSPDAAQGYWAAGRIWGGGLFIRNKVCFWVDLGTGNLDYKNQTDTFGKTSRSYLYRFSPNDHFASRYEHFPTPGDNTVIGSEISDDGRRVYLLIRNVWNVGGFDPRPVISVYAVE